jgi:hypothetical protein
MNPDLSMSPNGKYHTEIVVGNLRTESRKSIHTKKMRYF